MPRDSKRIWICTTGTTCCKKKPDKVLDALKASAEQEGVADCFEILDGGCVGMCGLGPNALVMSARTRFGYSKLKPEDAREIILAHKDDDKPVERLRTKNYRK